MNKKNVYIILGVSTLLAGAGIYFYVQSKKFVPTAASINEPISLEIDSTMITEPDTTTDDVAASPSGEIMSVDQQMFETQSGQGDY